MSELSGPTRDGLAGDIRRARRLEWLTLAYLCSSLVLLYMVLSGSQALKSEFLGDLLNLAAPSLFLIGNWVSSWKPTEMYPFGYKRATSAAYLGAALALLAIGLFLFGDSALKLFHAEHPSMGGISIFGIEIWIGWIALPILIWSAVPAYFLGRTKRPLAEKLGDEVLLADAATNAADWQSASAAIVGILGVAWGLWWADSTAALFISIEIIRDGAMQVHSALGDIMDRRPLIPGTRKPDPLPEKMTALLRGKGWIADAVVRMREKGREMVAEATVVPISTEPSLKQISATSREAKQLDNRLSHVAIVLVQRIPDELDAVRADKPGGPAGPPARSK